MSVTLVPFMLFVSSLFMAFAWLGHLRLRHRNYLFALAVSWFLVMPEYLLNVSAIRMGHGTFTGGEMAAFNLCTGVICVALVAHFFLRESLSRFQVVGFCLMTLAIFLVVYD